MQDAAISASAAPPLDIMLTSSAAPDALPSSLGAQAWVGGFTARCWGPYSTFQDVGRVRVKLFGKHAPTSQDHTQ